MRLPRAEIERGDDLLTHGVEPTAANEVVERLRELRIERPGAVALVREDRTEVMPFEDEDIGHWDGNADAIVIEEVVDEARENARLSATYLASWRPRERWRASASVSVSVRIPRC